MHIFLCAKCSDETEILVVHKGFLIETLFMYELRNFNTVTDMLMFLGV